LNLNSEHLYYKDRKQLKTFFTQIGSTLPLTLDPPVRVQGGRRWRPIKIECWGMFLPTSDSFSHPVFHTRRRVPARPLARSSPPIVAAEQRLGSVGILRLPGSAHSLVGPQLAVRTPVAARHRRPSHLRLLWTPPPPSVTSTRSAWAPPSASCACQAPHSLVGPPSAARPACCRTPPIDTPALN